ncbi:hypothetical protein HYE68_006393 [Fusarium pseudograminearum]|nr:hypothetical protein HYE68_006393 [Fusarium pseudograminearum]
MVNLKLLEKMRGSCPSRSSFMDFINYKDNNVTIAKVNVEKSDEISPTGIETKLAKTPLGDITNTHACRDNSEKHVAVKEKPTIFHDEIDEPESNSTAAEEQADGCLSPADEDSSLMIEEPVSPHYHYEPTGAYFSQPPSIESSNDETTSVTSEHVELNPGAPVFIQQRALEQQFSISPAFEVNSQDLSYFDYERSEAVKEESSYHHEAAGFQPIYCHAHEAQSNAAASFFDKETSPITEGYPPTHHEAAEPQSANASTGAHETDEFSPTSGETHALAPDEVTDQRLAEVPHYETVEFQHHSAYYDHLDTIVEESESEHDEVIQPRCIREHTTDSDTWSRSENSIVSSNESVNESGVTDSQISDTLEIGTAIVDPDTPNAATSKQPIEGEKKRTIRFDPNGDLYLKVGTSHPRNMLVDSRALGRASAKLHAAISQNVKDDTGGRWTIEFPEDDPKSFAILLNLIHARFEKVPANVKLDRLFDVCVLADKYGMTSVLRPVAERWYLSARTLDKDSIFKMAFIAWELGFATDFGEIVGYITHNCSLDGDSELVFGSSKERLAENEIMQTLPILTCIEEHRQLALETF